MAEFCEQCAKEIFGKDVASDFDFSNDGVCAPDKGYHVICEGCANAWVDENGICKSPDCLKKHGTSYNQYRQAVTS